MQYYFSHDGVTQQGPVDVSQLRQAGVTPQTLVWREGMSGWTPARDVPDVAAVLAAQPGSGIGPTPPPSPAPSWSPAPDSVVSYQSPQYTPATNGMAITSMVLGIVSIATVWCYFLGFLVAIVGIVFGHLSRGQIRRTQAPGAGFALAGLICAYISIGLTVLLIGGGLFLFAIMPKATAPMTAPVTVPAPPNFPTTVPNSPTPAPRPW